MSNLKTLGDLWVVQHLPTGMWWRQNKNGYTKELFAAGVYTEEQAAACERTRSPSPSGIREDRAERLVDALKGLSEGTVGAFLGLVDGDTKDSQLKQTITEVRDYLFDEASWETPTVAQKFLNAAHKLSLALAKIENPS